MTDRTYSQAEADALIAGAYLAVDALISKGWHSDQCASLRNQWHIDDPEACDCWNGLLRASVRELPPDDARLALEERLEEATMKEHHNHVEFASDLYCILVDPCADGFRTEQETFEAVRAAALYSRQSIVDLQDQVLALAAREAKLIADTRLDEAEWWFQYAHWLKNREPAPACTERLASLRAAVQGGASRDDS